LRSARAILTSTGALSMLRDFGEPYPAVCEPPAKAVMVRVQSLGSWTARASRLSVAQRQATREPDGRSRSLVGLDDWVDAIEQVPPSAIWLRQSSSGRDVLV